MPRSANSRVRRDRGCAYDELPYHPGQGCSRALEKKSQGENARASGRRAFPNDALPEPCSCAAPWEAAGNSVNTRRDADP